MKCETCKFFAALSTECRRNPPTAVPIQSAVVGKLSVMGVFPRATPEMWCGEYQASSSPES